MSVRFWRFRFCRSPQEYDFEILDGSRARSGPNSGQIREIGPEWAREVRQNLGNPYQMEDNKAAPSAPPQGGGASRRPLGFCCLPFGKDFLSFASFIGAHSGPISRIWSEFGPGPIQDFKIVFLGAPTTAKWKTTRRRLRRRPKGAALRAAPLGFVVFHLVRISDALPNFRSPFWSDFPNLFRILPGTHPGLEIV